MPQIAIIVKFLVIRVFKFFFLPLSARCRKSQFRSPIHIIVGRFELANSNSILIFSLNISFFKDGGLYASTNLHTLSLFDTWGKNYEYKAESFRHLSYDLVDM